MTRPRLTAGSLIPVFLLQACIFLLISQNRLVDGDEGFYLMTSRLVTEGKLPYRDFLLTQMPLTPYVYGWWMRLAGMTWISARALAAILTACLGTALYCEVLQQTGKRAAGWTAVLLFVSSTHIFVWFPVVKTYSLSTLLLFLAYRSAVQWFGTGRLASLAVCGLFLGLSVDARLYFAGVLPAFLWWVYRSPKAVRRVAACSSMVCGFALALLPNLYLLWRAPQPYLFDNFGFHALRSPHGLIGGFDYKALVAAKFLLAGGEGNGLQTVLLLAVISTLAIRPGMITDSTQLALALGVTLAVISLLPTPPYVQYFCVTIPFLMVVVVCSMSRRLETVKSVEKRRILAATFAVLLLIFTVSGLPAARRFLSTGEDVIGITSPQHAVNWRLSTIAAVSRAIDQQIVPGERVLSLWPGYVFQSSAQPYPGLENNSATFMAERLKPSQQAMYHILSPPGIEAAIAAHAARVVVVGNQESMLVEAGRFEQALLLSGYQVVSKIGNTTLWSIAPRLRSEPRP